jgi:NADPH:quinone reductase
LVQAKVVRFEKPGGPDVLKLETAEVGSPGAGQALVRQTAVGVNYIDVYFRSGMYPVPSPSGCGSEAAGVSRRSVRM